MEGTPTRRQPSPLALTEVPVQQRCGRCGHEQTVLGETTLCSACGGIIVRVDSSD